MGYGTWTSTAYTTAVNSVGFASADAMLYCDTHQVYKAFSIDPMLDPKGVVRECIDSDEHPNTFPIILALDVTGSMGSAARACAAKLDDIMTELYKKVDDVEFCMLGIGDMSYDDAPIQATQFESDIRIFDQTTKIYFEGGGGGNRYESYTGAWWFGLHHTNLDCWKRGKKGIIITLGDEPLNPVLYGSHIRKFFGDSSQDVETEALYKEVCEKFDVYHIAIDDPDSSYRHYKDDIKESWGSLLGQHLIVSTNDKLPETIGHIVDDARAATFIASDPGVTVTDNGIAW